MSTSARSARIAAAAALPAWLLRSGLLRSGLLPAGLLPAGLLRAWYRVLDYAYVVRWQATSVLRPEHPARYARHPAGSWRDPVLLLPGVLETWDFLRPVADLLHAQGHPIHSVPGLGRNRRPVAEMAGLVERYLEERDLRNVVVLAHSKGGLIGKYVMAGPRCGARVAAMVSVNTPFGGSRRARLVPTPAIRIFLPTDATLRALTEVVVVNSRITSIASRWDPHIPEGSVLAGATNVTIDMAGHFRVMGDPRLHEAVLQAVAGTRPIARPVRPGQGAHLTLASGRPGRPRTSAGPEARWPAPRA